MKTLVGGLLLLAGCSTNEIDRQLASVHKSKVVKIEGDKVGNGGDAIVCRDDNQKIVKAELLDYYEGRELRGIQTSSISENEGRNYLQSLTKKIEKWSPNFTQDKGGLEEEALSFYDSIQEHLANGGNRIKDIIFTDDTLIDVPDSMHLSFPKGCAVEQVIIAQEKRDSKDSRYTINSEILSAFSERDIVGLVLHEILYHTFITKLKFNNSIHARYVNQKLSIYDNPEDINLEEYLKNISTLQGMEVTYRPWMVGGDANLLFLQKVGDRYAVLTRNETIAIFVDENVVLDVEMTKKEGRVLLKVETAASYDTTALAVAGLDHSISMHPEALNNLKINQKLYPKQGQGYNHSFIFKYGRNDLEFDIVGSRKNIPIYFGLGDKQAGVSETFYDVINTKKSRQFKMNFNLDLDVKTGKIVFKRL